MIPQTAQDAAQAMRTTIIYHVDPVASVLASRLITLEARYLGESSLRRAYGGEWESLLGLMRVAETLTAEEEAILSDRLELRHRRLIRIGTNWLTDLGRDQLCVDVLSDLVKVCHGGYAERTMTALSAAAVAGMLHADTAGDTPITIADENDMTIPLRAVLISRGVNL